MATVTTGPSTSEGTVGTTCSFLNCDGNGPECSTFAQDCPEGQKCAACAADGGQVWNNVQCVEVTGMDKPGEACTSEAISTGIDSCVEGAMCWRLDDEGVGTCFPQCTGSAEAPVCAPGSTCMLNGQGVVNLCFENCDPLLQDCPDAGLCISTGDNFLCMLDASGEEGQANDPCEFINVCDPGLLCLDPATGGAGCDPAVGGCCTPFCKFPDGGCPNPDQSCVQWFDPMMLPEDDPRLDIGVCAVPS